MHKGDSKRNIMANQINLESPMIKSNTKNNAQSKANILSEVFLTNTNSKNKKMHGLDKTNFGFLQGNAKKLR